MRGRNRSSVRIACPVGLLVSWAFLGVGCGGRSVEPVLDLAGFVEPPPESRPWVRWWWPGADVEADEIAREVELLAQAGFGGFELQAFDAALDPDAPAEEMERRLAFDTPAYYALVVSALEAARQNGLQVDLTFGSGWPPGGVHLSPAQSQKTLMWNEWPVEGPGEVEIAIEPRKSVFYQVAELVAGFGEKLVRYMPEEAERIAVLAARVTGGRRSDSILDLADSLELDAGSVLRLSDRVDAGGVLRWQAPEGRWQVIAFFSVPDGEYPSLIAQAGDAFVVDHLDGTQIEALLTRFFGPGTGLSAYGGQPLRAIFTDSLELKVERFFCSDFLAEFERRRGYDLVPWLPAVLVPGADNYIFEAGRLRRAAEFSFGPDDERVRHDYSLTISELFCERYLGTVADWAARRGIRSRAQAYGADLDVIAAAAATDIPESEQLYAGGSELFLKIASSAALLRGHGRVSAEAMVFPLRDYMTTPAKLRAAADKLLGCGVNQVVLHGFPYDHPGDYGMGGWTAFSSRYGGKNTYASNFGFRTALFEHLPVLNRYIGRCQFLLSQGLPEVDLLVLYPWLGFPTSLAMEPDFAEPLLGGYTEGEPELREQPFAELAALFGEPVSDHRAAWMMALQPVLGELEQHGYTWAWIDPASLAAAEEHDDRIQVPSGSRARALLLAEIPWVPPDSGERLDELCRDGVRVLVLGELPKRQPGLADQNDGDLRVREAMERLADRGRLVRIQSAAEAYSALAGIGARPAVAFAGPGSSVRTFRRRLASGGMVVLLRNQGLQAEQLELDLDGGCPDGYWLDAWTGRWERVDGELELELGPWDSRLLVCGDGAADEALLGAPGFEPAPGPEADSLELRDWQLRVEGDDVPGGLYQAESAALGDWREIGELQHAVSPGIYRTTFQTSGQGRVELDLGWVAGISARVRLNNTELVEMLVPPFRCDLSAALSSGTNELEVVLVPAWRNRLVGLAEDGDARYAQFEGKTDSLIATGLIGPVYLRCEPDVGCRN
ncbi:MAG: hypothetical protein JXR96_19635 [Deltaproteobacteria bacterium]|nr:hypothetical protein [Deltaproteobacteria bacterium]